MDASQLHKKAIRIYRTLVFVGVIFTVQCTTLPTPKFKAYRFPKDLAFIEEPDRPYEKLKVIKTKVNFSSMDPTHDENELCANYYNKAARDLVKRAKDLGGDAVIKVRSVVFYISGEQQFHKTPECADDGAEGQILLQGVAIRWKSMELKQMPRLQPSPLPAPTLPSSEGTDGPSDLLNEKLD